MNAGSPIEAGYGNIYTAVCQHYSWVSANNFNVTFNNTSSANWVRGNDCPKGWGRYYGHGTNKPYVQCAQGYVVDGEHGDPIYGYVTRYRDVYYNYYSTRVAKS